MRYKITIYLLSLKIKFIITTLVLLALFIQIIKFFFKKDYNQISFFFLLPVIYYLNPLFPSGNFFNNWYMCFGILGLPFYLYLVRIKKSD